MRWGGERFGCSEPICRAGLVSSALRPHIAPDPGVPQMSSGFVAGDVAAGEAAPGCG